MRRQLITCVLVCHPCMRHEACWKAIDCLLKGDNLKPNEGSGGTKEREGNSFNSAAVCRHEKGLWVQAVVVMQRSPRPVTNTDAQREHRERKGTNSRSPGRLASLHDWS